MAVVRTVLFSDGSAVSGDPEWVEVKVDERARSGVIVERDTKEEIFEGLVCYG